MRQNGKAVYEQHHAKPKTQSDISVHLPGKKKERKEIPGQSPVTRSSDLPWSSK